MKILKLQFMNLNSLYGKWEIDFTAPEYDGIFAIVGATGAGKSTILDAISLALYGATPRLGKITSTNEIMSRGKAECSAEVTFAAGTGKYRCYWSQHRAHKKADGNLLSYKHEIIDTANGTILENKISKVPEIVEELTGMDYSRFTRSILLAQGDFAAFLKALPAERAPILEQITGTDIYSNISIKVFERQREEKNRLDLLKSELEGISYLKEDEVNSITDDLAAKSKEEVILQEKNKKFTEALKWHSDIADLNRTINELALEQEKLRRQGTELQPQRDRLEKAINASELETQYSEIKNSRKHLLTEKQNLIKNEAILPQIESKLQENISFLTTAENNYNHHKILQKSGNDIIRQVREIVLKIAASNKTLTEMEAEYRKIFGNLAEKRRERLLEAEKMTQVQAQLTKIQQYCFDNSADADLIGKMAGLTEQISFYKDKLNDLERRRKELINLKNSEEQASKQLAKQEKETDSHKQRLIDVRSKINIIGEAIKSLLNGKLLREYETEKENLTREMYYLNKIVSFEEERKHLEDDMPCPLCGSTNHPYAKGNVPAIDEKEIKLKEISALIDSVREKEDLQKSFQKQERELETKLNEAEKQQEKLSYPLQMTWQNIKKMQDELTIAINDTESYKKSITDSIIVYGFTADINLDKAYSSLKERESKWQNIQLQKVETDKEFSRLTASLMGSDGIIETLNTTLLEKAEQKNNQKTLNDELLQQRHDLFGNKDPDFEEKRLEKQVANSENEVKNITSAITDSKEKLSGIKALVESSQNNITLWTSESTALEESFRSQYLSSGFPDEETFASCLLSPAERTELKNIITAIDDKLKHNTSIKADREKQLSQKMEMKLTESTTEELKANLTELTGTVNNLKEQIGAIKKTLSDNLLAGEKYREKESKINKQNIEFLKWSRLNEYIGSADGKKFRVFAQNITFEHMVAHANRELVKMTDRYLLIRDKTQPLELNIIDNYQAGEIRSTKNLSGGESFLVSMALALGLSKMSGSKVRVDSLFLDEGFGTLDDEALEIALETLTGLQQDGKLIGVISHLSQLKERISTRISISKLTAGRSEISGPGCTKKMDA